MVGTTSDALTPVLRNQLIAIQRTARTADDVQLRLATGLRVNSAIDNPQNFFTSKALKNRSSDLSRLLDGIGQGIRTVQVAEAGLQAVSRVVDQAEAITQEAQQDLLRQRRNYSELILADEPVLYYRLNETSGTTAENLGTGGAVLNGTYAGGVIQDTGALHFAEGVASASFDGTNDRINIPSNNLINRDPAGYPERTIELTFKANDVNGGRQVLFEEGGTTNAIAIYIDNGRAYVTARDAGDFGPFNISAEIENGETYHIALTLDAPNALFTGYLNGEEIGSGVVTQPLNRHTAAVAIGRNAGGTYFHDGPNNGNGEYFNGRIGDVALYNDVLSAETIQGRYDATLLAQAKAYQEEIQTVLDQIDPLVVDAHYRGINLLKNDSLTTFFNEDRTSFLETEGVDFSASGLAIEFAVFETFEQLGSLLGRIRTGRDDIRSFGVTLTTDLSIIETRETFTRETINTLEAGGDDLTIADQNEEGANLLALQTRQQIQFSALGFSTGLSIADFLI